MVNTQPELPKQSNNEPVLVTNIIKEIQKLHVLQHISDVKTEHRQTFNGKNSERKSKQKEDSGNGISGMLKHLGSMLSGGPDSRGENRTTRPIYLSFTVINFVENPDLTCSPR